MKLAPICAALLVSACASTKGADAPAPAPARAPAAVAAPASSPAPAAAPDAAAKVDPWSAAFVPPSVLDTGRVHLEPLGPDHAALDLAAFTGSVEHLRKTLQWGDWPSADYPLEANRKDLEHHLGEFEKREAYAYTVQSADRSHCVGCVYTNPVEPGLGQPGDAMVFLWVVEPELAHDLDRHLTESLLAWFERDWPFGAVYFPLREANERGRKIAKELGLEKVEGHPLKEHEVWVWRRG